MMIEHALSNRSLKDLCTFGIGGQARYLIEVRTVEELQKTLLSCHQHKLAYLILGKGSNILFHDDGFDGLVILNKIHFCEQPSPGVFHVGAGYSFSLLGVQTARQGWSGLEFASGIPGSIGGAVFMNAGANGSDTATLLQSVDYIDEHGNLHYLKKKELHFSYRSSSFQHLPGAIAGAVFKLNPSETARQEQMEMISYRKKTQPYHEKSAGCVFRNPSTASAGLVIDQCGLKGLSVGTAKVSEMHANFIVNSGNATASDVLELIKQIKQQVKEKMDIDLESEIRIIPFRKEP